MDIGRFSSSQLHELGRLKHQLVIKHKANEDDKESVLITDSYIKQVGTNFCADLKRIFESDNPPSIFHKSVYTVVGCSTKSLLKVLRWTMQCCKGNGIVIFPYARGVGAYNETLLDTEVATTLGIPFLVAKLSSHLNWLESKPISSTDLASVLERIENGSTQYNYIVDYVASQTFKYLNAVEYTDRLAKNAESSSETNTVSANTLNTDQMAKKKYSNPVDTYAELRNTYATTLGVDVDKEVAARFKTRDAKRNAKKISKATQANHKDVGGSKPASTTISTAEQNTQTISRKQVQGPSKMSYSHVLQYGRATTQATKEEKANLIPTGKAQWKETLTKTETKNEAKEEKDKKDKQLNSWADEVNSAQ